MTQHHGRVTWFDPTQGYGFLACSHAADVFVDTDAIEPRSRHLLKKGDHVYFDIVDSDVGAEARAVSRNKAPTQAFPFCRRYVDLLAERKTPLRKLAEEELQIILLVEDAEEVLTDKSDFLRAAGYLVVTCNDIPMAFEVYRSNMPVDLVMLSLYPHKNLQRSSKSWDS